MTVIILAGGRGKRMGILTRNIQKATLYFNNKPLIVHVLNMLFQEPSISDIVILTGYCGNDIRQLVNKLYKELLDERRLVLLDFPKIKGTLSRLIAGLNQLKTENGCYVCGIDYLVDAAVFRRFCSYVNIHQDDIVLSLSPRINIAPTHKLAYIRGDRIRQYITAIDSINQELQELRWYTDVGIRYFPVSILNMLRGKDFSQEQYILSFIQQLLIENRTIKGFVFQEKWKHFATSKDLRGAISPF